MVIIYHKVVHEMPVRISLFVSNNPISFPMSALDGH